MRSWTREVPNRSVRGATLLEFTLAAPLLFVLLLGLVDLIFYVTNAISLEMAAQDALTRATFISGLEKPEDSSEFLNARAAVADIAKSPIVTFSSTFDSSMTEEEIVVLPGPPPQDGESRNPHFEKDPIVIRVRSVFDPILFPRTFQLETTAVGYRELAGKTSFPVAYDCNGNPFIPGLEVICNCPPKQVYNPQTGKCECPACPENSSPLNNPECECLCNPGFVPEPPPPAPLLECICNPDIVCPPEAPILNEDTCTCSACPPDHPWFDPVTQVCRCAEEQNSPPCPMTSSGVQLILDVQTCECRCPFGMNPVLDENGNLIDCGCPGEQQLIDGICQCEGPVPSCNPPMILTDQCSCGCPWPFIEQNGDCVCPNPNHVPLPPENPTYCACSPELPPCGQAQERNPETCQCECEDPEAEMVDGQCWCTNICDVTTHHASPPENCTCVCADGQPPIGEGCPPPVE